MKAPWLTAARDRTQSACGTCGALFILAIVYDRPACPLCGAPGERQAETEARTRTTTRATWRSGRKREQDLN